MRVDERSITIDLEAHQDPQDALSLLKELGRVCEHEAGDDKQVIRIAATSNKNHKYKCDLGVLHQPRSKNLPSIFEIRQRRFTHYDSFNAVFLVPTGIGAEIGGHSGDSGPVAKLLAAACDTLITHPNVGNAADINELPRNSLYVEGSVITDLLMGTIELNPVRSNRILLLMEQHSDRWFMDATINMASAARAAAGIEISEVVVLSHNFSMQSEFMTSGRAAGRIEGLESVFASLDKRRGQFDAVAIASLIKVPESYHKDYFSDSDELSVNPWGGVEAMLTHSLSRHYRMPTAHAPMMTSRNVQTMDFGPVDPRKAAEPVSCTYLFSVLKGLSRSPAIVPKDESMPAPRGGIGVEDIHCLIIPDGCVGLPTIAALAQGIPIIAVRSNRNCMENDLSMLQSGCSQIIFVGNYLEAVGVMAALRTGLTLESLERPIAHTRVTYEAES